LRFRRAADREQAKRLRQEIDDARPKRIKLPDFPALASMPEYRVHRQMLQRCYLKSARNYVWYGAKGVTVCDRWRFGDGDLIGFQCFIIDLGPRPTGLTLDRINPFGNYEPDNCRWATWAEQGKNHRRHHEARAA
jgi:hypothetical protein